jgi:bifunctional enzyme CysN/CysC
MADARVRAPGDLEAFLRADEQKDLMRVLTCGSVDDGKSTLLGRLLYDAKLLFDDQIEALESDSRKVGSRGKEIDFALVVDGLQAEREQAITIDVAYRFFSTAQRKFIVADAPGHEQYTRNMVTGASTADLAVLLVDARKGLLTQTRRHAYLCALLGIRSLVLAVNKMDAVGYDQANFDAIDAAFRTFAAPLGFTSTVTVPISALTGENVLGPAASMPWHGGPALLSHLETVPMAAPADTQPFRMHVQLVQRPNQDFRGVSGTIAGGAVRTGDVVVVHPAQKKSRVARIVTADGDIAEARAGQSVTLTFGDEIDTSRGDLIAAEAHPPEIADQFAAHIVWMDEQPLLPGRQFLFQLGTRTLMGQVTELKHKVDVNTLEHHSAKKLDMNEVGFCNVALAQTAAFDSYEANRATGAFIVIDRYTNSTAGAGMIAFGLRRAQNLTWQTMALHKADRAGLKRQKPCVLWFTGLSGAGKSTVANLVEEKLHALGAHSYMLDGDNVRHGLNRDLGFTDADRVENIRRMAEVARLMVDAGLIVLVSAISPFRNERQLARDLMTADEFFEIFVDTPLETCQSRDPKGLYRKAREGKIKNMTGIDSPYEAPDKPELVLHGALEPPDRLAESVMTLVKQRKLLG